MSYAVYDDAPSFSPVCLGDNPTAEHFRLMRNEMFSVTHEHRSFGRACWVRDGLAAFSSNLSYFGPEANAWKRQSIR